MVKCKYNYAESFYTRPLLSIGETEMVWWEERREVLCLSLLVCLWGTKEKYHSFNLGRLNTETSWQLGSYNTDRNISSQHVRHTATLLTTVTREHLPQSDRISSTPSSCEQKSESRHCWDDDLHPWSPDWTRWWVREGVIGEWWLWSCWLSAELELTLTPLRRLSNSWRMNGQTESLVRRPELADITAARTDPSPSYIQGRHNTDINTAGEEAGPEDGHQAHHHGQTNWIIFSAGARRLHAQPPARQFSADPAG